MEFDEFDEQENKNQFATYEQINDRQARELRDLLNRWEAQTTTPWDAMLELSHMFGAGTLFLISYRTRRESGPGTEFFENMVASHRDKIIERQKNFGKHSEKAAQETFEWIEHIRTSKAVVPSKVLVTVTDRLSEETNLAPAFAKRLKINDDIQGPQKYVDAIQGLIRTRDAAVDTKDLIAECVCETTIIRLRREKKEVDYDFEHIDEAIQREREKLEREHNDMLAQMKSHFRPEALDPEQHATSIIHNIRDIRFALDIKDFDSWAAAQAVAEVLLKPAPEKPTLSIIPINDFRVTLEREKKFAERRRTDPDQTLSLLTPKTEAEVKEPLARKFAVERFEREQRERFIESYKAANDGKDPTDWDFFEARHTFEELEIPENTEIPFQPSIDYPNHKLCNEIFIVPSGTGLIEVYPRSEDNHAEIYGADVARITTYSVSFVPKNVRDLNLLKETLTQALNILADVAYPYILPGWNPSGESYKRISPSVKKYYDHRIAASAFIDIADGKATPIARFDLDDLWVLYYLMEPVIEPSPQIAAAMNAARYAEERGAILAPDDLDYVHSGHHIADQLGYLKKSTPDLLAAAARDVLVMRALNKIDDAGLMAGMMVLAGHTLTGHIADIHGAFPTFDALLADQTKESKLITYDDAIRQRTDELMRCLVGLSKESTTTPKEALAYILSRISEPLRQQYRAQSKEEKIALYQAWDHQSQEFRKKILSGWDPFQNLRDDLFSEEELLLKISDTFAGHAGRSDEEREEARKGALTKSSGSLVIAASAVETALDGIHAGGRYQTRTKGSPLVRYELPSALERFNPRGKYQPTRMLLGQLNS